MVSIGWILALGCLSGYPPDFEGPKRTDGRPDPAWPKDRRVLVNLQCLAPDPGEETIYLAMPAPEGLMLDHKNLSVAIDHLNVEHRTRPLAWWWTNGRRGPLRSVQVQFKFDFTKRRTRQVRIMMADAPDYWRGTFKPPRLRMILADKTGRPWQGADMPRVLASMEARWLCTSWVAGPQIARGMGGRRAERYDEWIERHYSAQQAFNASWAASPWLPDRAAALYKVYIRTGDPRWATEAYRAATFYRNRIVTRSQSAKMAGACLLKDKDFAKKPDLKYCYTEGLGLHYLLTGDDRFVATIRDIAELWLAQHEPGYLPGAQWDERLEGLGWLALLHAYEVTGDTRYLDAARRYCDASWKMQQQPLDGLAPDGSWRHSAIDHGELKQAWGSSPWMAAVLVDAIFKHWLLTGDGRCPRMIVAYADFLDKHGISEHLAPYYFASSAGGSWGSAAEQQNNMEVCTIFAAAYYFTKDNRYLKRFDELFPVWLKTDGNRPPNAFVWSLRSSSQFSWLLRFAQREHPVFLLTKP